MSGQSCHVPMHHQMMQTMNPNWKLIEFNAQWVSYLGLFQIMNSHGVQCPTSFRSHQQHFFKNDKAFDKNARNQCLCVHQSWRATEIWSIFAFTHPVISPALKKAQQAVCSDNRVFVPQKTMSSSFMDQFQMNLLWQRFCQKWFWWIHEQWDFQMKILIHTNCQRNLQSIFGEHWSVIDTTQQGLLIVTKGKAMWMCDFDIWVWRKIAELTLILQLSKTWQSFDFHHGTNKDQMDKKKLFCFSENEMLNTLMCPSVCFLTSSFITPETVRFDTTKTDEEVKISRLLSATFDTEPCWKDWGNKQWHCWRSVVKSTEAGWCRDNKKMIGEWNEIGFSFGVVVMHGWDSSTGIQHAMPWTHNIRFS